MKKWQVGVFLFITYLLLAWKQPYVQNNLIGNLEPYPDTLYYSVPAWNFVNGRGFEMSLGDKKVNLVIPRGYDWLLVPFFWFSGDIRGFYWANLLLASVGLWLFLEVVWRIFDGWQYSLALGLIWVTNFYNYNLPSLLMAENLLIPLTLAALLVLIDKASLKNIWWAFVVGWMLLLTKMSALPVVAVLFGIMAIKIYLSSEKKLWKSGVFYGLIFLVLVGIYLKINLAVWSVGNSDMALTNFGKNWLTYFSQLMGKGGVYLWYVNPLLEKSVAYLGVVGLLVGLLLAKKRLAIGAIMALVLGVVAFHSLKFYPEGRYISTIVPLIIIGIGWLFEAVFRRWGGVVLLVVLVVFLGQRVTVNGFYERMVTTLKRQVLNNFRKDNEVPWNYNAVQFFNNYFSTKKDNVFLATLLPPFYVDFFSNHNYQVLPVSETQEFSIKGRELLPQYYKNDGSILAMYRRLVLEGNDVYITNYYLQNNRADWLSDFRVIENSFAFKQVAAGCMDLCKIYKLEIKPTRPAGTLPRQGG